MVISDPRPVTKSIHSSVSESTYSEKGARNPVHTTAPVALDPVHANATQSNMWMVRGASAGNLRKSVSVVANEATSAIAVIAPGSLLLTPMAPQNKQRIAESTGRRRISPAHANSGEAIAGGI